MSNEDHLVDGRRFTRNLCVKYALDRCCAFFLMIPCLPLLLLGAALIKLGGVIRPQDAGPVFFREPRISAGRPFKLIKFRTAPMTQIRLIEAHPDSMTLSAARERTWAGRWILEFYLDELPQLLNVLKGEMSLIGPRPQLKSTYQKMLEGGLPPLGVLKGGLLGIPQACKSSRRNRDHFIGEARRRKIHSSHWDPRDELYLVQMAAWTLKGMLWYDLEIAIQGIITVLRGESKRESAGTR